jgi:hypothetical protein
VNAKLGAGIAALCQTVSCKESATPGSPLRHDNGFRRPRAVVALVATSIGFAASACGAGSRSAADNRAISIYAAAIRVIATQPIGPEPTTRPGQIFVAGAHGAIPLSVQAGVADTLESFATIRFVDDRSEAIDSTEPHQAVHGNGILVIVGDIPAGREDVAIAAQRYERTDRHAAYTIFVHHDGATWKPVRTTQT